MRFLHGNSPHIVALDLGFGISGPRVRSYCPLGPSRECNLTYTTGPEGRASGICSLGFGGLGFRI